MDIKCQQVRFPKWKLRKRLVQAQTFPDDREPWLEIQPLERAFGEFDKASDSPSRSWDDNSD